MDRRSFLLGSVTGLGALALAGCTDTRPLPTPSPTATTAVPEVAMLRSRWARDEFARGATSFIAVGADPADREALAAPVEDRLFFAGEATSGIRPGTLRGAQASGDRAGVEVLGVADPGERVIVIGAGLAGASAAARLARAGVEVQVIEARERTGGRIDTRQDDAWPLPVELGAARVLGVEANPLLTTLSELGIDTEELPSTPRAAARPDGTPVELGADGLGGRAEIQAAATEAASGLRDAPLGTALKSVAPELPDAVRAALSSWVTTVLGAPTDELSSWYGPAELPGDGAVLATGALQGLVDAALTDVDVALGVPVTRVGYDDRGVSVRFATGESLSADRLVVTVPLGVLQAEGLEFDPPLPFDKRAAIGRLGVGQLETVWLRFPEVAWDAEAPLWSVVGDDVAVPEWINLATLTGDPVLIGLVGAERAGAFADLDDADAQAAALASLSPFLTR